MNTDPIDLDYAKPPTHVTDVGGYTVPVIAAFYVHPEPGALPGHLVVHVHPSAMENGDPIDPERPIYVLSLNEFDDDAQETTLRPLAGSLTYQTAVAAFIDHVGRVTRPNGLRLDGDVLILRAGGRDHVWPAPVVTYNLDSADGQVSLAIVMSSAYSGWVTPEVLAEWEATGLHMTTTYVTPGIPA